MQEPVGDLPLTESAKTVGEWVESRSVARLAGHAARLNHLGPEDSEDLAQEVALALLRRGSDLRLNSTFVFQTAKHKAADIVRGHSRWRRQVSASASRAIPTELWNLVRARVASLPDPLRLFFRFRFEEGLTHREIGERLRLSHRSVRWLESRLLRALAGPDSRLGRQENLSLRKILLANSPRPSD